MLFSTTILNMVKAYTHPNEEVESSLNQYKHLVCRNDFGLEMNS